MLEPLIKPSTLKSEVIRGTDTLVVQELTGGIYFDRPKFIEKTEDGEWAVDTMEYRTFEIERIARAAFEAARIRKKKVISVDKANILATSQLWCKIVTGVARDYADVKLDHMLVDN